MSISKREAILQRRLRKAREEVERLRAELAELREPTQDASDAPSVADLIALDPEAAELLANAGAP